MSSLTMKKTSAASVRTPDMGRVTIFVDEEGVLSAKSWDGTVHRIVATEPGAQFVPPLPDELEGPSKTLWEHIEEDDG